MYFLFLSHFTHFEKDNYEKQLKNKKCILNKINDKSNISRCV